MACISLQATSTDSLNSLFSPEREGRGNGLIHNALIWKSELISLSKGSNLPTENIIQLNAGKESSHFKLQRGETYLSIYSYYFTEIVKVIKLEPADHVSLLILYSVRSHGSLCQPHFPQGDGRKWISPSSHWM